MIPKMTQRPLLVEAVSIADDINDAILGFPFSTDRQFSVAADNMIHSLKGHSNHPLTVSVVVDRGLNQVRLHSAQPTVQRSSLQYYLPSPDISHVGIDSRIALLCHLLYWMSENTVQTSVNEDETDESSSAYSWKSLVQGVTERRLVATSSQRRTIAVASSDERPANIPVNSEDQLALFGTIDQLDSAVEGLGGWIRAVTIRAVDVVASTYHRLGDSAEAVRRGVDHFLQHWNNPAMLFGSTSASTVHTLYIDAADASVFFALKKVLEHSNWNVQQYKAGAIYPTDGRALVVVIGSNDTDTARRIRQLPVSENVPICGILLQSAHMVDPTPSRFVHYIAVQTVHEQLTSFLRERITDGVAVPIVFEELANNIDAIFGAHKITPTAAQAVLTEYAGSRVMRKGVGRGAAGLLQLVMQ